MVLPSKAPSLTRVPNKAPCVINYMKKKSNYLSRKNGKQDRNPAASLFCSSALGHKYLLLTLSAG